MSGVRVLVGTRKGGFVLTSDGKRRNWNVSGPHFGGWELYHMKGSPADPNRIYASQSSAWFGQVIRWGELLIGLGLLFGGLTAIAAFFGLLLNFSFIYAGSASSNPTFIILALLIILGWRVAGWWGLDRILLPTLGTPWAAVPPDDD